MRRLGGVSSVPGRDPAVGGGGLPVGPAVLGGGGGFESLGSPGVRLTGEVEAYRRSCDFEASVELEKWCFFIWVCFEIFSE